MGRAVSDAFHRLDWRDRAHYRYTDNFADRDWAWEGLRRNKAFQTDWQCAAPMFDRTQAAANVAIVTAVQIDTSLSGWGLLYSDSPCLDARDAAVVWRAEDAFVLDVLALPASSTGCDLFQLTNLECSVVVLATGEGQHVVLKKRGKVLQLDISGENIMLPVRLMVDVASNPSQLKTNLQAQTELANLCGWGSVVGSRRAVECPADRMRIILQALDGFLAGASLREIAVALFGADRVTRDWNDGHRHLKDRARRAVARGRWLMEGGYRMFLK